MKPSQTFFHSVTQLASEELLDIVVFNIKFARDKQWASHWMLGLQLLHSKTVNVQATILQFLVSYTCLINNCLISNYPVQSTALYIVS